MHSTLKMIFSGFTLLAFGLALTGCPKAKGPMVEADAVDVEAPVVEEVVEAPVVPSVNVGTSWAEAPGFIDAVRFDYMKADLTPEARASLKKNAGVLKTIRKTAPGVMIRVEGHCDDRGTLEYNMALGQRRAKAMRDYYVTLGVSKSALETISFGEERPLCTEAADYCWAQNRRGETTLKASTPVSVPLPN
jgi:peptidoglycan-associated lipoprotein